MFASNYLNLLSSMEMLLFLPLDFHYIQMLRLTAKHEANHVLQFTRHLSLYRRGKGKNRWNYCKLKDFVNS